MHQATIELRFNSGDPRTLLLETGEHSIGREHGDLVVPDHRVSALHGQLTVDASGVVYRDLGSSNGSFNARGQRLDGPQAVPVGQSVRLGNTSLTVIAHGDIKVPLSTPPRPKRAPQKTMMMVPNLAMAQQSPPSAVPPSSSSVTPPSSSSVTPPPASSVTAPPSAPPPSGTAPPPSGTVPASSASASPAPTDPPGNPSAPSVWDMETPNADPYAPPGHPAPTDETLFAESERRVRDTFEALRPHWQPVAKLIAMLTVPFALARWAVGLIPVAGIFLDIILGLAEVSILVVFIQGIVSQYALQIHRGERPSLAQARLAHSEGLAAWAITLLLSGTLTFIGLACLFVPGLILGWGTVPALLIHRQTGFDAAIRSAKVFMADWQFVSRGLVGLVLVGVGIQIASTILQALLPGRGLDTLVIAASYTLSLPFGALYTLTLYSEACQRKPSLSE